MPVLDTSFLIDLDRRRPRAQAAMDRLVGQAEPLLLPAQVAAEYVAGLEDEVAGLHLLETSFVVVPFGRIQVLEAGRLARRAIRNGSFPGWADAQVAALAAIEDTYVVSADRALFEVFGVRCWDHRTQASPPE